MRFPGTFRGAPKQSGWYWLRFGECRAEMVEFVVSESVDLKDPTYGIIIEGGSDPVQWPLTRYNVDDCQWAGPRKNPFEEEKA